MKHFLFSKSLFIPLLIIFLFPASCGERGSSEERLPTDLIRNPHSAGGKKENIRLPAFKFEREFHDFGRLIQGEQVSFGFKFENSGDAVLIISSVSTSCGCAVASFPNHPMKPGEEGVITVRFDSRGRRGVQTKTITLVANTQPNTKQLSIKANVVTPETMHN